MPASSCNRIPIVDLAGLRYATPERLTRAVRDIRAACQSTGFFYVINHEVPFALMQQVLAETARLFDLPQNEKDAMNINKSRHMRGYFGFGADKSDGIHGDLKEGFDLGLDLPMSDCLVQAGVPFHGPNVWPKHSPDFKPATTAYYDQMLKLGIELLRAFAIGLSVSETYFEEYFVKPIAQLRLLRYSPCESDNTLCVGAGEHTDFGCLTFVLQDDIEGLEIKHPDGRWTFVPAVPGALVVNIGDLMQRWTNDEYLATVHRVINRNNVPRYSAAFFLDPSYHTTIEGLPTCVSHTRPARYHPIVFGDYINMRYQETTTFNQWELLALSTKKEYFRERSPLL